MDQKKLWEVKHSYYCNEGSYFANKSVETYFKTLADFLGEMGDADMDYNLLFRWDWEEDDDEGKPNFNGDENYRNGKLKLFYMQQRRGNYTYCIVEVCRADEPDVVAFLKRQWENMQALWAPFA